MVLLIGLAVGVDYSMFYLKRERRGARRRAQPSGGARGRRRDLRPLGADLRPDRDGGDGRDVPDRRPDRSRPLGFATILVVAVAMLGSLTVLPALLSRLGDNVDRLRVPLVGRHRRRATARAASGARSSTASCARPAALGGPRRRAAGRAGPPGAAAADGAAGRRRRSRSRCTRHQDLRPDAEGVPGHGAAGQRRRQGGRASTHAGRASAIAELEAASARQRPRRRADHGRRQPTRNGREHHRSRSPGTATDAASNDAFRALRDDDRPRDGRRAPGRGGGRDRPNRRSGRTPPTTLKSNARRSVVAFVLLFAFALMLVAFRSIVVAIKAIVLNLLSVAAAYGVLVLVFQHGVGKGLLGFELDRRDRRRSCRCCCS